MPRQAGDGDTDSPRIIRFKKTSPRDPGLAPAKPCLKGELAKFKKSVEEWTGKTITDDYDDLVVSIRAEHKNSLAF